MTGPNSVFAVGPGFLDCFATVRLGGDAGLAIPENIFRAALCVCFLLLYPH